jgi:SseB protein N-terminal domain
VFKPVNRLEKLMHAAARDPKKAPDFYKELVDSELYILTPDAAVLPGEDRSLKPNESINVATVEFQGRKWHPAFTSKERISEYLQEPEACLGAKARDLFGLLPASNFWLNPKSECQKPLPADEIALILSGKIYQIDFMRHDARLRPKHD